MNCDNFLQKRSKHDLEGGNLCPFEGPLKWDLIVEEKKIMKME
jgi:hypothetical protein